MKEIKFEDILGNAEMTKREELLVNKTDEVLRIVDGCTMFEIYGILETAKETALANLKNNLGE